MAGRWLGGVCVGVARDRAVPAAWVRLAFVVGGLLGGLGAFVYVACWLIIPRDGEQPGDPSSGWLVMGAQAFGALVGLAAVAVSAAVATLFGFGWVVAALAAVVLAVVLVAWPRLGPGWAVLPVVALTLPSVAVAAGGLRLAATTSDSRVAPRVLSLSSDPTFRAGLGTMLVDLRRSSLPTSGVVSIRVEGGVRRTIVALPADRCVYVELVYEVRPLLANLAAQFTSQQPFSQVDVFGQTLYSRSGTVERPSIGRALTGAPGYRSGPVLRIDFTSAGGSLYVRDYPTRVDPNAFPDWPGYRVFPEPRPDTKGLRQRDARREVEAWRARYAAEIRQMRIIDSLMRGPCVGTGAHL